MTRSLTNSHSTRNHKRPALRPLAESLEGRALMAVVIDSAIQIGDIYQDIANEVATDSAGNVYVSGTFAGTVDFDPGPSVTNLSSLPGGLNTFLAKYDASGGLAWATAYRPAGGSGGNVNVLGIAADSAQNVYLSGEFFKTVDFDLAGTHGDNADIKTVTGPSYASDAFVLKLHADGSFAWVQIIPRALTSSISSDQASDIAVDSAGNVYTTGKVNGNTTTAVSAFAAKHDTNGNVIWLKQTQGAVDTANGGHGIAVDGSGNVLIAGAFNGKVDFDPSPTRTTFVNAPNSAFIWKLTAAGDFTWVRTFNAGRFSHVDATDIALDASGSIYTSGHFQDTIDFDPGKGNYRLTAGTTQGTFISKLDANGNFAWARNVGGTYFTSSIGLDQAAGIVYVAGSMQEVTADFDPGTGTAYLTSRGNDDGFVVSLTMSTGSFDGVAQLGGTGGERSHGIAIDPSGNVYAAGFFSRTVVFGSTTLTSHGDPDELDAYLVRLHRGPAAPLATSSSPVLVKQSLTPAQVLPAPTQAPSDWRSRGANTSALSHIDFAIADLGEAFGSTMLAPERGHLRTRKAQITTHA